MYAGSSLSPALSPSAIRPPEVQVAEHREIASKPVGCPVEELLPVQAALVARELLDRRGVGGDHQGRPVERVGELGRGRDPHAVRGQAVDLPLADHGRLERLAGGVERLGDRAHQAGQCLAGPIGVDVVGDQLEERDLRAARGRLQRDGGLAAQRGQEVLLEIDLAQLPHPLEQVADRRRQPGLGGPRLLQQRAERLPGVAEAQVAERLTGQGAGEVGVEGREGREEAGVPLGPARRELGAHGKLQPVVVRNQRHRDALAGVRVDKRAERGQRPGWAGDELRDAVGGQIGVGEALVGQGVAGRARLSIVGQGTGALRPAGGVDRLPHAALGSDHEEAVRPARSPAHGDRRSSFHLGRSPSLRCRPRSNRRTRAPPRRRLPPAAGPAHPGHRRRARSPAPPRPRTRARCRARSRAGRRSAPAAGTASGRSPAS